MEFLESTKENRQSLKTVEMKATKPFGTKNIKCDAMQVLLHGEAEIVFDRSGCFHFGRYNGINARGAHVYLPYGIPLAFSCISVRRSPWSGLFSILRHELVQTSADAP